MLDVSLDKCVFRWLQRCNVTMMIQCYNEYNGVMLQYYNVTMLDEWSQRE